MTVNSSISLGTAFRSTKEGQSSLAEEAAHAFYIRNADNKDIGHVQRQPIGKWAFKIFGEENLPMKFYDSKEDALEGARKWLLGN
jgi:hypothetical protein